VFARTIGSLMLLTALAGCGGGGSGGSSSATGGSTAPVAPTPVVPPTPTGAPITGLSSTAVATFAAPWSMAFLPDGRLLVTERVTSRYQSGTLSIVTPQGVIASLTGLPSNYGMLDVVLHPRFSINHLIYFSFLDPGDASTPRTGAGAADTTIPPAGLAVATATLTFNAAGVGTLGDVKVIWRQTPKIVSLPGSGEPGGRLAFSPDETYLFIAAGDRQEMAPVQQLDNTLGKMIRLNADGSIPTNNPFVTRTGALPEIWTLGHRNAYGLAFDPNGRLWSSEMGPMGGDEFNLIESAGNYGWPLVSYGSAYSGGKVYTDPKPGDGFVAPATYWTPVIAPAGMIFYTGTMFGDWRGDAILTGLQSKGLVRVRLSGTTAAEVQRLSLGARIRGIAQGPDGALWVLEDAPTGRLLKLTPIF